jgi:hypothetical protein
MSVLIAQGWAAIVGTTTTNMGAYFVYNDGIFSGNNYSR